MTTATMASFKSVLAAIVILAPYIRITHQQSYRNLFVYKEIDLQPSSKLCGSSGMSVGGDGERVAAVHVVDQSAFDVPCHCMLYSTEGESITQINIKHQDPDDSTASWQLQFSVMPSQWDDLEQDGLVFQVKQTHVEILTESGLRETPVAVAIEVGKSY